MKIRSASIATPGMSASTHRSLAFASALLLGTALGVTAESYMSLVGELVGEVEGLRMLRDHCASFAPETAVQNARAYDAWVARNAAILAEVKTQTDRADVRIGKQAAANPSAPKSTAEIISLFQKRLSTQLQASGPEAQRAMCAKYPEFITTSEKKRQGEIESLLTVVRQADEALSKRGQ